MKIRLVPHEEIDRLLWDSCIHYAGNGNVFGYTWFLNNVTKEWDALVEGEYESVLPLPKTLDRLNRPILRQPNLIRELGVYSVHILSPKRLGAFLKAIPDSYKSVQLALNERNVFESGNTFDWQEQHNHQLLLTPNYDAHYANYENELVEQLKVQRDLLIPISNIKPERLADFYKQHTKDRTQVEEKFHAIQRIMYNALHRGAGFSTGVTDLEGNLLAANCFIYGHKKALSWLPIESKAGKEVGALNVLLDQFIQSNAGRPLILDFNTHEEYPLAFGAQQNIYYQLEKEERSFAFLDKLKF
ncbi:MAG: hypothetical protein AAGI23_13410 [Bacteroidota bacterium]